MYRLSLLLGLLLFHTTVSLHAQSSPLFFEWISAQNGLSNNKVNCVLQDKRGFMWIGTNDGLNRYDGHNFIIFRNKPDDSSSISGNIITDLLEDEEGILWIASSDGLTRYDYRASPAQQFKQYKHSKHDSLSIPVNRINSLVQDQKGYLWLAASGVSVLRFDKKTGRFDEPIHVGPSEALDLCLDARGIVWAGRQGGGIVKFNPVNLSYDYDRRYDNLYANLPHVVVTSLYRDKENNMWYGSWDKAVYKYDQQQQKEIVYQKNDASSSFTTDEVRCFAQDSQGNMWIGGKNEGLQIFNKSTGEFSNYQHNPMQEGSLADNMINCLYINRQGEVWIGTNKGISLCKPSQQKFKQVFLLPSRDFSTAVTVYDFYKDENKDLWIGTSEGIFLKKNNSNTISHIPLTYQGNKLTASKFYKDKQGTFYVGTNYSLFVYDRETGALHLLPNTEKDKVMNKIIESRVISMTEDVIDGHPVLLVSPYGHYLAYYDLIEQRWVSRLDTAAHIIQKYNIRDNLIRKLFKSSTGKIWMAEMREGLGEWITNAPGGSVFYTNDPSLPSGLSNNYVYDIAEDDKKNLWISTYGGGLNYMEVKGRKITHITATSNLLEGISLDEKGNVWMISDNNLQKYDIYSKSSRTYTLPDLEKTGSLKGYIYKDEEGIMYMGGDNYYIAFNPDRIDDKREEPRVFVTDFKIFNTSFSHLLNQKDISLSYRQNYFTLEFAAPDYSSPEPMQYEYMLEGFSNEWVEAKSINTATYSNLPGGTYTFRVRASNNPGVWREMEQPIRIIIIPPFWKRWWFYLLCAAFVSAAIYMLYRYRINELLKRQAMRNKIAQDLHDNVGSTLSSISVYSQVAQIQNDGGERQELNDILGKISITSTDMISEMNDIVWAINPRNDNMEKIVQRMESFAKPLLAARGIQFRFQYDPAIFSIWLDMEQRKNFYLIFKEAINNIIKYAEATSVTVDIIIRNRKLELLVKDNGVGFDPALIKTDQRQSLSGNGLRNMKMRAAEMKAALAIHSKPGEGTSVHLVSHIP